MKKTFTQNEVKELMQQAWDDGRDFGNLEGRGSSYDPNDKPMPHRNKFIDEAMKGIK